MAYLVEAAATKGRFSIPPLNEWAPEQDYIEEVQITQQRIDGAFKRHILSQIENFKIESETYSLKGLITGLHVYGRQTGIPTSVTNVRGPVSQLLVGNNTLKRSFKRKSHQRQKQRGGKRKTRKLNKNNRKRRIKLKKSMKK